MTRRIVWSFRAQLWIESEAEYLLARSPAAAFRFRSRLAEAERLLGEHPHAGRPHQRPGVRQLLAVPYVLRYREAGADIVIIDIRHARQQERPVPDATE